MKQVGVDWEVQGRASNRGPPFWHEKLLSTASEGEGWLDGLASAEVGGPSEGNRDVRFSRRLAAKEATPVLLKAIALRARREDLEHNGGGRRTLLNRKKLLSKSAMCRVQLNVVETNSFMEFVSPKV